MTTSTMTRDRLVVRLAAVTLLASLVFIGTRAQLTEATDATTEEPTELATEEPTAQATEPTGQPTEPAATDEPTEQATEAATESPIEANGTPTEQPTEAVTDEPTDLATEPVPGTELEIEAARLAEANALTDAFLTDLLTASSDELPALFAPDFEVHDTDLLAAWRSPDAPALFTRAGDVVLTDLGAIVVTIAAGSTVELRPDADGAWRLAVLG